MNTYLEFAQNHTLLVTALVASLFFLLFTELRRKAQGITNIEPQDAVKLINADALVLDLRSSESFARGHIVNAKNVAVDELSTNQDKYTKNKSRSILVLCDAGVTSAKAVDTLRKAGAEHVYGLKGGVAAWTQANLPLVTAKKTRKGKGKA
jgi:rhodanese-related sulfurtransferase